MDVLLTGRALFAVHVASAVAGFLWSVFVGTDKSFYGSPPNFSSTKSPVLKPPPDRIS